MRFTRLISIVVGLFLFAVAAWAEDARTVLDRAIRAHGGEARLERTKKGRIKSEIKGYQGSNVFKVTREEIFDLPTRCRRTIDVMVNGKSLPRLEYAVTGNRYWIHELEKTRESSMEPLLLGQHWQAILAQLPLLRDKDTQLISLPDQTKDGRTLLGIRAASPRGAVAFYFDKSTGLLAQAQWALPSFLAGQEMMGENFYEDYRDIKGVRYPMKVKGMAENAQSEIAISSVEFLDKIEDSVFAKPRQPEAQAKEETATQTSSETKPPSEDSRDGEETPAVRRDTWLIAATLCAGIVIGAVWLFVRASKRGKRQMPPS